MGKDDFENSLSSRGIRNRRHREEFETIEQESREDGAEMEKRGAYSNTGVGDEENPIGENEEE